MNKSYTKNFEIRSYEVDIFQKLKISSLFAFFQEVASLHAAELNVGYSDLAKNFQAFWALSRITIKFKKYPVWQDQISYHTWPKGYNRLHAFRDFNVVLNNTIVASGSSDWIIMNLNNKQIVNPDPIVHNIRTDNLSNHFEAKTKRIKPKITHPKAFTRMVRYNDLDMNQHVNSIKYLDWVFDCLPLELLTSCELEALSINYLHEIAANNEVEIQYSALTDAPLSFHFTGKTKGADHLAFIMELKFRKN